jgi:hypothetical protein
MAAFQRRAAGAQIAFPPALEDLFLSGTSEGDQALAALIRQTAKPRPPTFSKSLRTARLAGRGGTQACGQDHEDRGRELKLPQFDGHLTL